jgi:hypothetical protein
MLVFNLFLYLFLSVFLNKYILQFNRRHYLYSPLVSCFEEPISNLGPEGICTHLFRYGLQPPQLNTREYLKNLNHCLTFQFSIQNPSLYIYIYIYMYVYIYIYVKG